MAAGVPWRRVWVVVVAVAVAVAGVVVVVRADGFAAVDATVPRATRWFLHEPTGRAVLVDGFAGKSLARIEASEDGDVLQLVQSASGVALVDRSNATIRAIDAAQMRLGPEQSVELVGSPGTLTGFGQPGAIAVDPATSDAVVVPPSGEAVPFTVDATVGADTHVSPDGAIWTLGDGSLSRATTNGTEIRGVGLGDAKLTLVGNEPLVLDLDGPRVRYGAGRWVDLPSGIDSSEFVLQEPGPAAECGWVGADDELRCVGAEGTLDAVTIDGLDIDGSDLLAIAGDAGVVVRPGVGRIDRIDWRAGRMLGAGDDLPFPSAGAELALAASVDLVWVDDVRGEFVWAIHPWGMDAVSKNDASSPLLGESGDTIDRGENDDEGDSAGGLGADELSETLEREPDDDGQDDPPEAIDDQVTSRFGVGVPIVVTANDYDPDGEAIAISSVTNGRRGEVSITDATTVLYSPEPNLVGTDSFEYTIVDGNGTEDTATVTVELLPVDAPNQGPVGALDRAQTSRGAPVVIDVLINDIDPERDQLRVSEFEQPARGGTVVDAEGPTGLPALAYRPPPDITGLVRFEYTPMDSFGATGEPVQVLVDIADDDENRSPLARPDALRVRRDVSTLLPVLANDVDPDGDPFVLQVDDSALPDGLDVDVVENQLRVRVLPGSADLLAFPYTIDDQVSEPAVGRVLVAVIPESEPNRPPVANADNETAVVGEPVVLSVLANDKDPDDDPIRLVSVAQPETGAIGTVTIRGNQVEYLAGRVDAEEAVFDRFTYTITDGRGNTGIGEVTVRVLPEPLPSPPFARDDNATTEVDRPVTIDVLRNDGDPSGEIPVIVGQPGCPAGGVASITSSGEVRYVPPAGRTGVFSCSYEIRNSQGLTATASILIDVTAAPVVNRAPVVPDVFATVTVGATQVIDLLQNATDPDDDVLRVVSVSPPPTGRIEADGNTVRYTAPLQPGDASFTFMVGDGRGATTPGRVSVRIVEEAPVAPEASPNVAATEIGVPVTVDVVRDDVDPDGDRADLVISDASVTSGSGTVSISGRELTVTPAAGFEGEIVITYEITDPDALTDTSELRVTVTRPANQPPVARDDVGQVINGGTVVVSIALNDADPDGGDVLTYRLVSGASSDLGQAALDGTSLIFEAAPGAFGTAVIGYSVTDGTATATAVVRISVAPCSVAAPEAPDRFFSTGYMTPIQIDLTTEARNGDIVAVGPPLDVANGVYTPPAGFNDNVTFSYTVRNSCRIQDTGTVTIDVNQDPVPGSVNDVIGRNETLSIPVSRLASDDEPLTIVELVNAPEWVTIADGGASIAVAPAGRAGRADLTAVVADPGGLRASVPVAITLTNLAPVAVDDSFQGGSGTLVLDLLANDSDPDPLDTVALQSVPATVTFANGVTVAVEVLGNSQIRIHPGAGSGVAQFTYTIVDSQGLPSQPATVTITVNSPPSAPTVDITVVADQTPQQFPVPATDPDGQPLVLELIDTHPQLTITVDGLNLTIVAAAEARNNTFALGYRVTDPLGASAQGVLNIRVIPPTPPPPTTAPVEATVQAGDHVDVTIPASDPAGGPPPTITIPDNPTPLEIVIVGLDVHIDAPRRSGGATYVLTYRAETAGGGVGTNTLTVVVQD